ncbi:hypothetical protein G6F57_014379 [Rhizopus arrhizus]|nr:hypothetical protein G6F57_014379 [Rhizopus arrhizus]
MLGRHRHQLRLDPLAGLVVGGAGIGQHARLAAGTGQHRQLRRQVGAGVAHQQLLAIRRQREVFHAVEAGQLAHLAAAGVDRADFIVMRGLLVAQEVEALAIGRQHRCRGLPLAAGQRLRLGAAGLGVQMREARFLGQQPQRAAVGHPAEIVEAPVDPGVVGQPVAVLHAAVGGIDADDPAVLVVVGTQHYCSLLAVGTPADATAHEIAHHLQAALALQRVLAGLAAQLGQRIGVDAGQAGQRELLNLAGAHVDVPQGVRLEAVAANAGAGVLGFLVARFGHVQRHLAATAVVEVLRLGHHDQVAQVRRQHAVGNFHIGAQVHRARRAGRVGLSPALVLVLQRLALVAVAAQGFQRTQLLVAQHVGLRRRTRVLLGLQAGHLLHATGGSPVEPVLADAPDHAVVGREVHVARALVAAGQLGQRAAAQVAHEHVAIADERTAAAAAVVDRLGHVQGAALVIGHLRGHATGHRLAEGVAHRAAVALELVLHLLAVPRPPGLFDRRPDPVRVGHGLFDGDRRRRGMRGRCGQHGRQQEGQGQHSGHGRTAPEEETGQG